MIVKKQDARIVEKLGGSGLGKAQIYDWLGNEPMCPNLKMLSTVTLEPGATVGDHPHNGEAEIYYIAQGSGEYNDNGQIVCVQAGDVTVCYDGQVHGLNNTGGEELVFYAVIVKG